MRKAIPPSLENQATCRKTGGFPAKNWRYSGFTLIELLVCNGYHCNFTRHCGATRFFNSLDRSKEVVLRQDLSISAMPLINL